MKNVVNKLLHRWGYHVANLTFRRRDLFADANFSHVYAQARDYTTTPPEGLFAIYKIVRHLVASQIPGAFVDCAAWRAGGSIAVMETLLQLQEADRDILAFDLFDQVDAEGRSYWNAADFAAVRNRVYDRVYPAERIRLVAGDMRKTIPSQLPEQIAFVQMDVNRYEVTAHLLRELYPRLSAGGCVFVTDYGSYLENSGRATEEFLATLPSMPLVHRVDHSSRYWQKN